MTHTSNPPSRVCVIGGGIIGSFIAYRLSLEGVSVTLFERDRLGSGASGASAGNVQILADGFEGFHINLGTESLALYRKYLPSIKGETKTDPLDHEVRYLFAAKDEDEAIEFRRSASNLARRGLKVEWLDGHSARELEPRLNPGLLGGILHSDCVQMDAGRLVSALARSAQLRGAYVAGSEVVGLEREGGRVVGVRLKEGTVIGCDAAVLAMGAWTGAALFNWLNIVLPIKPLGLQKIHLLTGDNPLNCAVRSSVNIVSRRDGMTHVGSKQEPSGFDVLPTEEGKRWLIEQVNDVLPGLNVNVAEAWAGCAVRTPEAVPILGPIDELEGLYVAAPSANGFLLAAVMAEILANYLLKGEEHSFWNEMSASAAIKRATNNPEWDR